jgi:hypothetical protein
MDGSINIPRERPVLGGWTSGLYVVCNHSPGPSVLEYPILIVQRHFRVKCEHPKSGRIRTGQSPDMMTDFFL